MHSHMGKNRAGGDEGLWVRAWLFDADIFAHGGDGVKKIGVFLFMTTWYCLAPGRDAALTLPEPAERSTGCCEGLISAVIRARVRTWWRIKNRGGMSA